MKRGLLQQRQASSIAVVLFAAILTDCLVSSKEVFVTPNTALLNEGDRTDLLCNIGTRIRYCRISIPGEEKTLNLSPEWSVKRGFSYHGAGFESGQCGVTIEHVKAINNGKVECTLGDEGDEYIGNIDLVVTLRPQQPIIELLTKPDRNGNFQQGTKFQARCIVRDGRPAANITWLMDQYPADKNTNRLEIVETPVANSTLFTSVQDIQWELGPEDNGRKLICRSHHKTDRENLPPQEGAVQLLVRFPPVRQPEQLVYGLFLERTAVINITIQSNPRPTVEWTIDDLLIPQGRQEGRYAAYEPVPLGHDYYNVSLAIAGLTLEDTTKTYQFRASNELGITDYQVRISSSVTPPTAGLDIGAIVGIVVAAAVLVLIILLIVFARATGRWCFGGKSIKTATNETSDTESAEVKATSTVTIATTTATHEPINEGDGQTRRTGDEEAAETEAEIVTAKKSKRHLPSLSAMFKRLNERDGRKKKYTPETDATEAEAAEITAAATEADQQNAERTDGNDNEPKEDKQLVYAELVLKPTDNNEPPLPPPHTENSTEYAEIVYVQKPQAEQSKK